MPLLCEVRSHSGSHSDCTALSRRNSPVYSLMAKEVAVLHRLNSPVVSTEVNTDTIAFQRYQIRY